MALDRAPLGRVTALICLAGIVLALGLTRLHTGPWYSVYAPTGARVLEGAPVAWETRYYLDVIGAFTSDAAPPHGLAPVHHRTFIGLFLGSLIYSWTGRIHASLAAVDLLFWFLAGVANYLAARRFGLTLLGAGAAAVMTAASPLLVSNMWRHDLHVANFATMSIGLWAMLAAIDDVRRERQLIAVVGGLLVLLSLSYQYQWTLLPVVMVLLRLRRRSTMSQTAWITAGSVAIFALGTLAWRGTLDLGGLAPSGIDTSVVSNPGMLLTRKVANVRTLTDFLSLLPQTGHVVNTVMAYHPLVFVAGWAGLLLLSRAALLGALGASAAALFAVSLYGAPWTAMSAYPFIYIGAGRLCDAAAARWQRLGTLIAITGALVLVAVTNTDLWGDYHFMLQWWRQYAQQPVF